MSIPDIIISMIVGGKRTAYCRIAAHDVFQALCQRTSGRMCNLTQSFNLKVTINTPYVSLRLHFYLFSIVMGFVL